MYLYTVLCSETSTYSETYLKPYLYMIISKAYVSLQGRPIIIRRDIFIRFSQEHFFLICHLPYLLATKRFILARYKRGSRSPRRWAAGFNFRISIVRSDSTLCCGGRSGTTDNPSPLWSPCAGCTVGSSICQGKPTYEAQDVIDVFTSEVM